jgi:hypothetical protein
MSSNAADFEDLLYRALAPVEPPEDLAERLETTLVSLAELASGELEAWELGAMKDPRNWARPVAAAAVGTTAGAALVLLRARRRQLQRQHQRRSQFRELGELAERTVRDVATEARRIIVR